MLQMRTLRIEKLARPWLLNGRRWIEPKQGNMEGHFMEGFLEEVYHK